ncbi:DUF1028 domain-containing protein [Chitinophaga sp. Hz27]|uniref:DUF1028 domain-containing protein n=1 Tax=Chitinophaga sp. Hz27 TaxID=3347169 RepID=UPI0035E0F58A
MKKYLPFILLLLIMQFGSIAVFATWSIIIVDPKTKEIGIAGASCTGSVYGIGGIIPGKGAVVVQAMSNKLAKIAGLQMVIDHRSPQEIIDSLRSEMFYPEDQQYGVVCLYKQDEVKVYSGKNIPAFNGALTAPGISVQGNTLSDASEIQRIMDAVIAARKRGLGIADQLMIALEAGSEAGGDRRCGAQKASSAFITVCKPADDMNSPSMNIIVNNMPQGGPNAVVELRKKYNKAMAKNT